MVVMTRLGKVRLQKEERMRYREERRQEMLFDLERQRAMFAAAGRPGPVYREPRDDRSVYSGIDGPEEGTGSRPKRGDWWNSHKMCLLWGPNRRLSARTRFWRAWQCYAFDCVVCFHANREDCRWIEGVNNVDSLRCNGCGADAFEMVAN